jgi:RHS repeat-associated protein
MKNRLETGASHPRGLAISACVRLAALLASVACVLAIFPGRVGAIEPVAYTGRYDGTVQRGPDDPCPNSASFGEALSCACKAWSSSAYVCPGLYARDRTGTGLVADQSGQLHKCASDCSLANSGLIVSAAAICPAGPQPATTAAGSATCVIPGAPSPEENLGTPNPENVCPTANPIHPGTGNKFRVETDYVGSGPMPLQFSRTYNGDSASTTTAMGVRWTHTYERRIRLNGLNAWVYRPNGSAFLFSSSATIRDPFHSTSDRRDFLERVADDQGQTIGWRLSTYPDDQIEEYDASGTLTAIRNRAGLAVSLTYSDATTPASIAPVPGLLVRVEDPMGRALAFAYDPNGRVQSMTDPSGAPYTYQYDDFGNLVVVTNPDGTTRRYHYGEPDLASGAHLPSSMTGITDENGARYANFSYDPEGRAVSSELAGGAERVEISYLSGSTSTVRNFVDPTLSSERAYHFSNVNGIAKNGAISGDRWASCGPKARSFDSVTGFPTSATDWNDHLTLYHYDSTRGLEISRTEASGTAASRTITTEWHTTFRLPTRVVAPGRETTMTYDDAGNLVALSLRDTVTNDTRTWSYTYNSDGQVLTADGPRTDVSDVITYTYYPNDDADPGKRGNLASVADAAGHATHIVAYNAFGQPAQIVDPNGLATMLVYDARQRLISRQVGDETTTYAYDGVGQLTRVTLPDASGVDYTYDAAHRLTQIADSFGNRVEYTLDAMGNRTREDVRDAAGVLAETRTRVYSALNRLSKDIGARGQITSYGYDGEGNLTSIADPLGRLGTQSYDALNRLVAMTDSANGVTQMAYDPLDQLRSVTDPRNLQTQYTRTALGDLASEQSPDSGATARRFDAAGNVLSRTNANGTSATYTYDALNRITRVAYSDGQIEAYSYDQGANGIGRLTGITDGSGTTAYAYDVHGRITRETRTIGGQSYATGYSYDTAGRLSSMTYPSGRVLTYTRDGLGRIAQIDTSENNLSRVLVQAVSYFPFGGVKSFTYGSLAGYTRTMDEDGRIAAYSRASESRTLIYDEASRIIAIRDPGNAANDATFGYDQLDRLTAWNQGTTNQGYGYDAAGNRTSLSVGGASYSYSIDVGSNRLNGVAGPTPASLSYDASGSLLASSATGSFTHDARLRLVRATVGSVITEYQLNALGQRVAKTGPSGGTHYHYDAAGRLIAESDATGKVQKEYVWLGDTPVAMIDSALPPAETVCPATPQLRPLGGFTPYEQRERMEVHSGRPGERGWEWGLGTNTRDFEASAREDVNWVSGKPYAFRLTYDGAGNATVRVTDAGAELFTLTWTGDMDVGNALRFVVRSPEGIGAGNLVRVDITSIDGQPVTESLSTTGDDSASRDARIFFGESLEDGYTVEGSVTFVFSGAYPPKGNQLDFLVTAGHVACDGSGSGGADTQARIFYIHPDHLDTPRVLTDDANRVVWRWDSDPFGAYPADEDPDGDGTKVAFNLRFPGQYFDRETNLHYNYFRDYDPSTGRYVQSDPIGLAGGLNPYAYARLNAISNIDPNGQFGQLILGAAAALALWALPELLLPDPPVEPGSGVVYPATFPDGSGVLKCVTAFGVVKRLPRFLTESVGRTSANNLVKEVTLSRKLHGEAAVHAEDAIRAGKPDILTIDRSAAAANRRASTGPLEVVPGKHLDEYPPAMFQEGGAGASVRPVNPRDNMAAGACIGNACRGLPNGAQIRIKIGD